MTHNILRCDIWLNVLRDRVDDCIELLHRGIPDDMLDKLILAVFFVIRECR